MSDTQTPVGGPADDNTAPAAGLMAQYVKDLSFENPSAPVSNQQFNRSQPGIDVNVNVSVRRLGDEAYEAELKLKATAKTKAEDRSELTAYIVELAYAGLFGIRNIPEDQLRPFLLIQGPTMLFPFARRVIADAVRDGGFQPLMLEPINFDALYQQQLANGGAGLEDLPQPADLN